GVHVTRNVPLTGRRHRRESVDGAADDAHHRWQQRDDHVRGQRGDEERRPRQAQQEGSAAQGVGEVMLTVPLKLLIVTSTAASLPPSPNAPSSVALRIRWSDVPTHTCAATALSELSSRSKLLTWSAVHDVAM